MNNVMIGYVVPSAESLGRSQKVPKFTYNKKSFGYIYRTISNRIEIDYLTGSYGRDKMRMEFLLENPDTPRRIAYFITNQSGLETTDKNLAKAKIFVDNLLPRITKSAVKKSAVKKSNTANVVMVKPALKSKDKFKVGDKVESKFSYNYTYNNYMPVSKNQSGGEKYSGKIINVSENWYDVKFEGIDSKVGFPKSAAHNFMTKI